VARATAVISSIEGTAQVGALGDDTYGASAGISYGGPFGPGSIGRKTAIVWIASAVWLVLVWRAVEGY
jgi:hypothetical protein